MAEGPVTSEELWLQAEDGLAVALTAPPRAFNGPPSWEALFWAGTSGAAVK